MLRARVEAEWLDAGVVTTDAGGRLMIPRPADRPGLYMFSFWSAQNFMEFYIGEGGDLNVRTGAYRTATGQTEMRIRNRVLEWLEPDNEGLGNEVRLWVAYDCHILFEAGSPGEWTEAPFEARANRLVAESAAVAQTFRDHGSHVECLNRLTLE